MPHKYLLLVVVLLAAVVSFHAQTAERVIGNDDVMKMHADGVSDAAIISKIRGSATKFDTASATILALKDAGLSDAVLLAMVEAKPVVKFPLKDAVGTRKVFISTVDKASEMEIAKDMRDAGYEIVQRADEADLVMDFAIYKSTGPHYINDVGNHWARMIVSLRKNGSTGEIYRIDKKPDFFNSKNLNNQAKRFVRLFLEALLTEL